MTMNENSREFKAGDLVRYVGGARGERVGYVLGYETVIAGHDDGGLQVADKDGDLRVFFDWEWQHASNSPSQAPQATSPILPSAEALDRFEALLGRFEAILGGISKGEVK